MSINRSEIVIEYPLFISRAICYFMGHEKEGGCICSHCGEGSHVLEITTHWPSYVPGGYGYYVQTCAKCGIQNIKD